MKPAEKYRAWKAHRPEKPIFRTILFSMMAVLLAEVILLSTGIGLTNVSGRLNQNAKQIVNMQVRNRASYLQDMLIKAQELTDISTTINNLTQQMLQDGTISLDTMDQSSEAADPLMEAAAPYLVSALRARPVTGIFLVINTHDLAEKEVGSPMPSVYLRDLDPDARPSDRNTDLMLERSSAAVVKALGITTDKSWSTALNCRGLTNGGFVRTVFQTAWEDDEKLDAADYGRWLTQTYKLTGDERTAIAYSQPLILPDGTVYGVIGVEILTSYLETKMPYQELQDGGQGTYLLVSTTSGLSDPELFLTLTAGDGLDANVIDAGVEKITCRQTDGERWLTLNDRLCGGPEPGPVQPQRALLQRKVAAGGHGAQQHPVPLCPHRAAGHHRCGAPHPAAGGCEQPAGVPRSGPPRRAALLRGAGSQRQTDLPQVFAHRHPGAGPLCGGHHPAEQQPCDQLHQVFAHHGHGQCGAGRLRAAV